MAAQSRSYGRLVAAAASAVAVLAVALLAAGCGGSSGGHPATVARHHTTAAAPAPVAQASSATPRPSTSPSVIPVPPPPANLHQTRTFPSARSRIFRAEMTDLWTAVRTGTPRLGAQAFFPLSAYRQIKAIYNPAGDWQNRLFADFRVDVFAAHRVVGRSARLVRVIVPSAEAAWITPGVCANSVGYWHVGGARLVYRQNGRLRSIGIASLISWRGRWYVVHLGAVLRSGTYGIVDSPALGPGTPGPAGGC